MLALALIILVVVTFMIGLITDRTNWDAMETLFQAVGFLVVVGSYVWAIIYCITHLFNAYFGA